MVKKINYPFFFKKMVVEYYLKCNEKDRINKILKIFKISNGSLFNWLKLYRSNNLTKIAIKKTKFTPNLKCYIRNYVISRINFDYKRLIKLIKKRYNIIISKSSIYNILNKMNITQKKIIKKIIVKNKKEHRLNKRKFVKIVSKVDVNKIISIDEVSFDSYLSSDYGWSNRGNKIISIKRKCKKRYTYICGISNNKIIYRKRIVGSANALDFIDFIKKLVDKLEINIIY